MTFSFCLLPRIAVAVINRLLFLLLPYLCHLPYSSFSISVANFFPPPFFLCFSSRSCFILKFSITTALVWLSLSPPNRKQTSMIFISTSPFVPFFPCLQRVVYNLTTIEKQRRRVCVGTRGLKSTLTIRSMSVAVWVEMTRSSWVLILSGFFFFFSPAVTLSGQAGWLRPIFHSFRN